MFMSVFFESKQTKVQKNHLKNLISLAKADGKITNEEYNLIVKAANQFGYENSEVDALIESAEVIGRDMPESFDARFNQIYDIVELMLADGEVSEEEMDFAILLAEKLGFRKAIVGVLVARINSTISLGISREEMKAEAKSFA